MQRTWIFAALLLLASCAEEERKVTPDMLNFPETASGVAQDADLPVITFENTEFHFDTIAIGQKIQHTFRFTNTGSSPLLIGQVQPSCGCTTLKDWPQQPILPGEGGTITAEFNSTGFPGPIEKTITVSTNCVPADWYLKLRGYVSGTETEAKEQHMPIEMERQR